MTALGVLQNVRDRAIAFAMRSDSTAAWVLASWLDRRVDAIRNRGAQ